MIAVRQSQPHWFHSLHTQFGSASLSVTCLLSFSFFLLDGIRRFIGVLRRQRTPIRQAGSLDSGYDPVSLCHYVRAF